MTKHIFEDDEMAFGKVDPEWNADELLDQKCIFYLKDICPLLEIKAETVKKRATELEQQGVDIWNDLGLRRLWTHWIVRMQTFKPYYQSQLQPRIRTIQPEWDINALLRAKGTFLLTGVCRVVPITPNQMRYRARTVPNSRQTIGVWKDDDLNAYLVDMEHFAAWLHKERLLPIREEET